MVRSAVLPERPGGRLAAEDRRLARGGEPQPRRRARQVPAPAVRRPAAAHADRPRAAARHPAARRRRDHQHARRLHADRRAQPARRPQAARPRDPLHHARPVAGQLHLGQRRDPATAARVVELGGTERVFGNPLHPYTQALLASVPSSHTKWSDDDARTLRATPRRRRSQRPARRGRGRPLRRTLPPHDDLDASTARRDPVGGTAGRVERRRLALEPEPDHPARPIPRANSIFNSAVVPFGDGFAGVFRVDDTRRVMNLHAGPQRRRRRLGDRPRADRRSSRPTRACAEIQERFEHAYDPRVTWLEDRYYVTWCNGYHGPTIGLALHARLRDVPPARQRVPAVQPQRRALPAPDRRQLRDAQPPERQRPHAVRRHLLLREPRPRALGPAPSRDGAACRSPGSRRRSAPARRRSRPTRAGSSSTTAS